MVSNVNLSSSPIATSSTIKSGYSNTTGIDKPVQDISSKTDTASVSTLSRQLGESAVRAEAREKSMTREQLGEFAKKTVDHILGESYVVNKARHDAEVPKTDDPVLIERARLATIYVNKSVAQDPTAKNPFADLTLEQAVLIAYDDKGSYTVNERQAAWSRSSSLEQQWRAGSIARAGQEYSNCGKNPKFMTECLEHYKALPAIERARYDKGYESRLETSITEHGGSRKSSERTLNLYEILAGIQLPEKKKEQPVPGKNKPEAVKPIVDAVKPCATILDPLPAANKVN
ncbi:hypothetical protein K3169_03055 [Pseudomonas phytophila]|uniref:Uncharacterized protein n=1 Tax=Pseudomonas phytophila TaxID=2867264 RepID=A0ABY6FG66_9PSED|nr:hypothetical protein [Pseudomonas phytophila]UXZ96908.1 hypothetical protein K3169_03055 [Pseudomonas phytophila]